MYGTTFSAHVGNPHIEAAQVKVREATFDNVKQLLHQLWCKVVHEVSRNLYISKSASRVRLKTGPHVSDVGTK